MSTRISSLQVLMQVVDEHQGENPDWDTLASLVRQRLREEVAKNAEFDAEIKRLATHKEHSE